MNRIYRRIAVLVAMTCTLAGGCATPRSAEPVGEEHLVMLKSKQVILGVWPQCGGRVVVLRRPGGANLLYAHPEQWSKPEKIPTPSPKGHFAAFNGHNIWLGPQGGWWTQQKVNEPRRKRKSVWPPDPFLTYGAYTVKKKSDTSITLVSPESPVSGAQLTKTYSIQDDGTVQLAYLLKNIRKTPISWDIWSNTRVSGTQNAYVPLSPKKQDLRIDGMLPVQTLGGFLLTRGDTPVPAGKKQVGGKAFLYPGEGVLCTFGHGLCLIKRAKMPPAKEIHPDQAFVEIYQAVNSDPAKSFMELEMHSAYKQIPAGGTHSFEETWSLIDYSGKSTPASHVAFLKAQGIGVKK